MGARNSLIFGEVEAMAPGTTRTMTAVIPPGRFRLGCTYSENATVYSPVVTVSGAPVHSAHPYRQVTYSADRPFGHEISGGGSGRSRDPGHGHRSPAGLGRWGTARSGRAGVACRPSRLRPARGCVRHVRGLQRRDRWATQRTARGRRRSELDRVSPARVRPVAGPAGGDGRIDGRPIG